MGGGGGESIDISALKSMELERKRLTPDQGHPNYHVGSIASGRVSVETTKVERTRSILDVNVVLNFDHLQDNDWSLAIIGV